MKIRELKENEPLKVTRVTYHFPAWPDPSTGKVDKDAKPIEDERIKTIIFTDGEIEKQTEETFQSIDEFYIGKSKYHMTVDTLETKNIYFKNHSYVITYLLAKEFMIKGQGAYSKLKYESGSHRVQRVPVTESNGRIQTSTATVLVMPEAEDVNITIDPKDLRIDIFRSSGCGGQGVNTTDSAVRITHLPTNTVVTCQNERSQIQNKEQAMKVLKARLYDLEQQKHDQELGSERRSKIGTGDRAEKIRTYNYPQNRVTDHRIGFTTNSLDRVMNGQLDEIIDALTMEDQRRKLAGEEA